MRSIGLFWFLLLGLVAFGQQDSTSAYDEMLNEYYERSVPLIQPEELYKKIVAGEKVYLLDAREQKEYEVSSLNGAIHVGFLFFSKRKVSEIEKDDLIVVYCTIGARSETIGERLVKNDFENVYNLYGGIIQWKNEGYPVYKSEKETENVHVYSKKWGKWLTKGKAKY